MSQKNSTEVKSTVNAPSAIASMTEMSPEQRSEFIARWRKEQQEKFEKTIDERAKRLDEKLQNKSDKDRAIIVRKVQIKMLREEINERRAKVKALRAEVKQVRTAAKDKKKGVDVTSKVKNAATA